MPADDGRIPSYVRPFFEGLEKGIVSFPRCGECAGFHWYPMPRCPKCLSGHIEWVEVDPRGRIFTHTSVHHAFSRHRADKVPYEVALVELPAAPGIRLVAEIVGEQRVPLSIGMEVSAVITQDEPLPRLLYERAR